VLERETVILSKDYSTRTFVVPAGLHRDILKNQSNSVNSVGAISLSIE